MNGYEERILVVETKTGEKLRLQPSDREGDRFRDLVGKGKLDLSEWEQELPSLFLRASPARRTQELLRFLVDRANQGEPRLVSYAQGIKLVIPREPGWTRTVARKLIHIAQECSTLHLHGLRDVKLDTFLVHQGSREPNNRLWECVAFSPERWRKVLGEALLFQDSDFEQFMERWQQ